MSNALTVLDLFSAACGGWSLGMHRAGFRTVAACEAIDWRRTLYGENNPGVPIYDDVRTLTAGRLAADLGALPTVVVGSPPCQDISSANTGGRGVEGARSGLFFEAIRIIGEVRPRWFALENSANLRTRGADAVLSALEDLSYTQETFVVGGDDIGANHERKRAWIIGFDPAQVTDPYRQLSDVRSVQPRPKGQGSDLSGTRTAAGDFGGPNGARPVSGRYGGLGNATDSDGLGRHDGRRGRRGGLDLSVSADPRDTPEDGCRPGLPGRRDRPTYAAEQPPCRDVADANQARYPLGQGEPGDLGQTAGPSAERDLPARCGNGVEQRAGAERQMGLRSADRRAAFQHRADWSLADLARHIRLDDGLPAWVAGARVAVGGASGTSAASLLVEAFGDAVIPQIPEAIGRAILRVEAEVAATYGRRAA